MTSPFLGEIRTFGFNFPPRGWALCNGQILPISQYTALFSLLGTNYGGDGRSNFALPNLQGQVAIGQGAGASLQPYSVGETGGANNVTITTASMPAHNHLPQAVAGKGNSAAPSQAVWAEAWEGRAVIPAYTTSTSPLVTLNPAAIGSAGSGQAHSNYPPLLVLNFCIAMQGIYPPRN